MSRRLILERPSRAEMSATAALGFAPHSGWSVLVGLGLEHGDARPRLLDRRRIELSEVEDPGSKQPYHAVESLPLPEAARRLASFEASAERLAEAALAPVLSALAAEGRRVVGVGLLESAGRRGASLEATLASHALIHTADGEHFREALAAASRRSGLSVTRVKAKELRTLATEVLGETPDALEAALQAFRGKAGPPWGADQKAAALLAWIVLKPSA